MPVHDLYSRRKRRAEQTEPDVYQYDLLPESLRTQIQFIWDDAIGNDPITFAGDLRDHPGWALIRRTVCREIGKLSLAQKKSAKLDCVVFLQNERDTDLLLDLIEYSFFYIDTVGRRLTSSETERFGVKQTPNKAIEELNTRFRQAAVGYRFEAKHILRVDSELIHSEMVRPALRLLSDGRFAGPEQEFLSAHAHYRAGEHKDCVTDALNAFESTMKAICKAKGWEDYAKGATASHLVKHLRAKGLIPDYLEQSFDQLVATLMSGLPRVRNEEGGHGQGALPRETPSYVAAYALHLSAAKIVFLVKAMEAGEV